MFLFGRLFAEPFLSLVWLNVFTCGCLQSQTCLCCTVVKGEMSETLPVYLQDLCRIPRERLKHGTVSSTRHKMHTNTKMENWNCREKKGKKSPGCWYVTPRRVQRMQKKTSTMSLTISSSSSASSSRECSSTFLSQRHSSLPQPLCVSPQRVITSNCNESSKVFLQTVDCIYYVNTFCCEQTESPIYNQPYSGNGVAPTFVKVRLNLLVCTCSVHHHKINTSARICSDISLPFRSFSSSSSSSLPGPPWCVHSEGSAGGPGVQTEGDPSAAGYVVQRGWASPGLWRL